MKNGVIPFLLGVVVSNKILPIFFHIFYITVIIILAVLHYIDL